MKRLIPILLLVVIGSCKTKKEAEFRLAEIETDFGNMTVKLYNETPQHRDNFVKLVKDGFYDDLLFHRVMSGFMIQGGDPKSKGAPPEVKLGEGGPGYRIPAEFVYPELFHKKGALAAARQGDQSNPEKKSSGSQFYIVQGKKVNENTLRQIAVHRNDDKRKPIFNKIVNQYRDSLMELQLGEQYEELKALQDTIMARVDREFIQKKEMFTFTPEQIAVYDSIGGTPHLDGNYTVFGQVIEGLNIIDSIATVETNSSNRPLKNVTFKIKMLN